MILSLRVDLVKQSLTFQRYLRLPRSLQSLAMTRLCDITIRLVIASNSEAISGD
jgi:hypothetical protein